MTAKEWFDREYPDGYYSGECDADYNHEPQFIEAFEAGVQAAMQAVYESASIAERTGVSEPEYVEEPR